MFRMFRLAIFWGCCLGLTACQDDWNALFSDSMRVEEGIKGELSLSLCVASEEDRHVSARNSESAYDEQHI
ncbi:secreted protein, partial [gut metagenome]